MLSLHPRFVSDLHGCNTQVVLSVEEWNSILEELEELEDIRDADQKSAGIEDISSCRFYTICVKNRR